MVAGLLGSWARRDGGPGAVITGRKRRERRDRARLHLRAGRTDALIFGGFSIGLRTLERLGTAVMCFWYLGWCLGMFRCMGRLER